MSENKKSDALLYHEQGRPGKIEVVPTKPTQTKRDLSLAYSPGVAEPCLEIAKNVDDVYKYTAKGNLVAVISNGTAVLGLGDIGPEASKPVMEGKGLLFKIFADIDVFDIELNTKDVEGFVQAVKAMEPTFGGINLEDIAAPESFEIEKRLKKELKIPVMHDDQHGTAIISGAALINALKLVKKDIGTIKMVINGAGASAIACGKLFVSLGVQRSNIYMLDSKGVITTKRTNLDEYKGYFARETTKETLAEAIEGADVFIGLSRADVLEPEMIVSMANDPIVFAMANPDPEIEYELAVATRPDLIMATGRSDHPNQVNNVLGFPFIFRGALDVRAMAINEEMKLAAVHAIAGLAHEPVPDVVNLAYNETNMSFGPKYIIPKPIDPRLITVVAPAVAKAAMESGVARIAIDDWEAYESQLLKRMGLDNKFVRRISVQARQNPKRVVFAEADNFKILKAAQMATEEGIAHPILLGRKSTIEALIEEHSLSLPGVEIIDPFEEDALRNDFGHQLFERRKRKGLTLYDACKMMKDRNYFGTMMVETGMADSFISGLTKNYPSAIRPALQIIGRRTGYEKVAGMYIIMSKQGPMFFADTTVNINPSADDLCQIVKLTYENVKKLQVEPRIAMLSYSNFGSAEGETPRKIQQATAYLHKHHPEIVVDGEMQANFALNADLRHENFPFSKLENVQANTFIFPDLASGNIAYKMVQSMGSTEVIGPILMGFRKSIHVLQLGSSVREIMNMIQIAVVDAQSKEHLN
ncbi:MAG: malate dehydrogenase (oxaloacetate-decarboxylating)(NADP+) [Bacteroidia bacterium]|jgi:malate dehydrogenase (oxaloacetate-decarboxylating)(NADP+)